jgi:hypothetical protein
MNAGGSLWSDSNGGTDLTAEHDKDKPSYGTRNKIPPSQLADWKFILVAPGEKNAIEQSWHDGKNYDIDDPALQTWIREKRTMAFFAKMATLS